MLAKMIEKGISRIGKPIKEIEESIEIAGKFEVYKLIKRRRQQQQQHRFKLFPLHKIISILS